MCKEFPEVDDDGLPRYLADFGGNRRVDSEKILKNIFIQS